LEDIILWKFPGGGEKIAKKGEKLAKKAPEDIRLEALEWSSTVHILLDEKYFEKAQKALAKGKKGKADFKAVCLEAGIKPEKIDKFYESVVSTGLGSGLPWAGL